MRRELEGAAEYRFAWLPIWLSGRDVIWLENYWRQRVSNGGRSSATYDWWWEYSR